jgi:hypothetical protein
MHMLIFSRKAMWNQKHKMIYGKEVHKELEFQL